ncbi:MAG: hypothetical protein CL840_13660 [Crocinitomicaceae bacterium]|nr:hypothetical protein [Crocinitomicaceae bacterium]|tara:strand:+ start:83 stop:643 length:561 start_codon:yes stop_codon:yes gene_type:complete
MHIFCQQATYSLFFGPEFMSRTYAPLIRESIDPGVQFRDDKLTLFSISPTLNIPLYKTNSTSKLRPSLSAGYFMAVPRNAQFIEPDGSPVSKRIAANQAYASAQVGYYFPKFGIKVKIGYHNDYLQLEADRYQYSSIGYGGSIFLALPFRKDGPNVYGPVISFYKQAKWDGIYWTLHWPFPIGIIK